MGGGPASATDYSRGHSAVRISDSHRHEVDRKQGYWRNDVEAAIIRHVADRHDADELYAAGDEGGGSAVRYLRDLGFDTVRIARGNHDTWEPAAVDDGETVIADDRLEWEVDDGERTYTVGMAHRPTRFGIRLGTDAAAGTDLRSLDGDLYDLVITGHSHFPRHHRLNPRTVADHAGSLKENYLENHESAGISPDRSFAARRFWDVFPRDLRDQVPLPDRSFAVHRFYRGITTYRYDAEELAEAYVEEDMDIADVEPDSVSYFPPAPMGGPDDRIPAMDRELPAAMTD